MGVNLGNALPSLLKAKGMTQDELAAATGIRRTDINALARGRIDAGKKRLGLIADALDVSLLELGAPEEEAAADRRSRTLLDRQEELEAQVLRLTRDVGRLARQVAALQRQAQPGSGKGRAAR